LYIEICWLKNSPINTMMYEVRVFLLNEVFMTSMISMTFGTFGKLMSLPVIRFSLLLLALMNLCSVLMAGEKTEYTKIPDEFESTAGHSIALANTGTAAMSDISVVRLNPALLCLDAEYSVSAGYHWPTMGRDFFQAGVVDAKTSATAAGFTYTGFSEKYDVNQEKLDEGSISMSDSPVKRRANLAFAQRYGKFLIGIGGQYLEAQSFKKVDKKVTGAGFGFGVAGLFTQQLRYGLSVENIANKKIADYAPTTYRGGLAYLVPSMGLSLHLDYRHRQRVLQENPKQLEEMTAILLKQANQAPATIDPDQPPLGTEEEPIRKDPEQMMTASFSLGFQNVIRLLGAYGQSVDKKDERKMLSGGVAVVGGKFSISYSVLQPYLNMDTKSHQSVNLNLLMTM